jgi:galactokinase
MLQADAHPNDRTAQTELLALAQQSGLRVQGGRLLRTSSRFCLGVEHGDYNGTELFGVGTDRFLWTLWRQNDLGVVRLFSGAFANEGVVQFTPGKTPAKRSPEVHSRWARFPLGVDHVLQREGYRLSRGIDLVLHSDIPGGGMSRSASLCLNLLTIFLAANEHRIDDRMRLCELAQQVENDYVGASCGLLDQVMIGFARAGQGTHFDPAKRSVQHIALGNAAPDFRFVALDTGTVRNGLLQSTYTIRRRECEELTALLAPEFGIRCLAEVRDAALHNRIQLWLKPEHATLAARLQYLFAAQQRFAATLTAWRQGDIQTIGANFRADGIGLRDLYQVSGPELETMCDLARTVAGVYGERMLGGGDFGASGAIVARFAVPHLRAKVAREYPRLKPLLADRFAVHELQVVEGITELPSA